LKDLALCWTLGSGILLYFFSVLCCKVDNINQSNDDGLTVLHNGVCSGSQDVLAFLIHAGCDVNVADCDGWCVLQSNNFFWTTIHVDFVIIVPIVKQCAFYMIKKSKNNSKIVG